MSAVVPDLQSQYPLTMILFSGYDDWFDFRNSSMFILGKTEFKPPIKKNMTLEELEKMINSMDLLFFCSVWCSFIDTPELNTMLFKRYINPEDTEYKRLYNIVCNREIENKTRQNVLILDFRYFACRRLEAVSLDKKKFFFGKARETYIDKKKLEKEREILKKILMEQQEKRMKKSQMQIFMEQRILKINSLKRYFDTFCQNFDFDSLEQVILECHKYALSDADTLWINLRQDAIQKFKALERLFNVFDMPYYQHYDRVLTRFASVEDLQKEFEMIEIYRDEILEMYHKMKIEYKKVMSGL